MSKIAIVGATGSVGLELVKCLHSRPHLSPSPPHLYASSRSAGSTLSTAYGDIVVKLFDVDVVKGEEYDFIFLAVSGSFSTDYAKQLCGGGDNAKKTYVIDNSSAFRYDKDVPLVVPEINFDAIKSSGSKLIANPNCTTAIASVVLWPIHQKFEILKVIMSTYQAASGAGERGIQELLEGTKSKLDGNDIEGQVFSHPLPFNCIPFIDVVKDNGYSKEEMKVRSAGKLLIILWISFAYFTCIGRWGLKS